MFIPDVSELSNLLKRKKKKPEFNKEVIEKYKTKFEDVRSKVNDLLKQCSKNEPCYNLVKTVNTGKTIYLTETNNASVENSEKVKHKLVCSTSKKSRKTQLSCTSETEIESNNVSMNSTISNKTLPQVFSKKSRKLIRTLSSDNSSVKNLSAFSKFDSSSSDDEPIKKPSIIKPKTRTKKRSKKRKRYLTIKQQKKLARRLKRCEEIRNLPQFDKIHRFLRGKDELKGNIKMVRPQEVTAVPFWNTYTYLVEEIERCISRNDWNNLTRLLIALADGPKTYQPFLLKASLINLLCNPAAQENDLTQFLQECFSCHNEDDMNTVLTTLFHIKDGIVENDEKINNINLDTTVDSDGILNNECAV